MDFVPIEQLVDMCGLSRRQLDRKIKRLKKDDPQKFKAWTILPDKGKRILYKTKEFTDYLVTKQSPVISKRKASQIKTAERKAAQMERDKILLSKWQDVQMIEQINDEPELIDMDADAMRIYRTMKSSQDKARWRVFMAVLYDYQTGMFSMRQCLERHKFKQDTFYRWVNVNEYYKEMYAKAQAIHRVTYHGRVQDEAKEALSKMITGYDKAMEKQTYTQKVGPNGQVVNIPQERTVQIKHVIPNVNAIVFAMTNRLPEDWKRSYNNLMNQGDKPQDPLEQMSDKELLDIVENAKEQGLISQEEDFKKGVI